MCFGTDFWMMLRNSTPVRSSASTRSAEPYSAYTRSADFASVENLVVFDPMYTAVVALRAARRFASISSLVSCQTQMQISQQPASNQPATSQKPARNQPETSQQPASNQVATKQHRVAIKW